MKKYMAILPWISSAPVADCVQEPTNRPVHFILEVLTNEENVRYALRGHRTVYHPGRARHHPVADGRLPQNPNAKSHPRWSPVIQVGQTKSQLLVFLQSQ